MARVKTREFIKLWKSHVDDFDRLRWNLTKKQDVKKLEKTKRDLMALVKKASKERKLKKVV